MVTIKEKRRSITILSTAAAIVLGLVMFIPVAQAEQPYDLTACGSGTITLLSTSKELTVYSIEGRGIVQDNLKSKLFDGCTWHAVGVVLIMDGKKTGLMYTKVMDPDGDFFVSKSTYVGPDERTGKILHGTGKWKGITGGGKSRVIIRGKPITPGTVQACSRTTGTFKLPKK